MGRLAGRIALVTGGAMGIGGAAAARFVAEGAEVLICDIDADSGAAQAEKLGNRAMFQPLDVTDEAGWQAAIAQAEKQFGGLDILVNAAGISEPATIETENYAHWRKVLQTNLDSIFLGCHAAIPALKKRASEHKPAAIVNIGSSSGLRGAPFLTAYGASKAGLIHLTKTIALHCGREKHFIRCNAVHPGAVRTPMYERYLKMGPSEEAMHANFVSNHPIGFIGEAEDLASAILFLASDEARFITGADLAVDGGLSL